MDGDRLQWFRDAAFGMFVHWGIYAVPAGHWPGSDQDHGEWIQQTAQVPTAEYEKFAAQFNPTGFDAEQWVGLAKDAGMKYLVVTTKHHDGFCMFDTKLTDYNIVQATPYGRDPMKALAVACERADLPLCFYYSVKDWHHPEYPTLYTRRRKITPDGFHAYPNPDADYNKYLDYLEGHMTELLSNYGPIGIMWFDMSGGGPAEHRERAERVIDTIHRLQPDCLINNRFSGIGADYGTPEQHIPGSQSAEPFEVCMTLNRHWAYNRNDDEWKDAKTVVSNLADIRGKGGNYLLNVGPTAEGIIPDPAPAILREVGQWLRTNGESIYPAGPKGRIRTEKTIASVTSRPGRHYLHVHEWPEDRRLFIIDFYDQFRGAYLLADPQRAPLKVDVYRRSLMIHLPDQAPDPLDSVVVLEIE